jgi:hypothetical protein
MGMVWYDYEAWAQCVTSTVVRDPARVAVTKNVILHMGNR